MRLVVITMPAVRHTATQFGAGLLVAGVGLVAFPIAAQAHVEIQPGEAEAGEFVAVAFGVPNERDNASTTRLRVILPLEQPIGAVQLTPMPGWKIQTKKTKLSEPVEVLGAKVDTVISEVTWTSTTDRIRPGEYRDFNLRLGQLPEPGEMAFSVLQTYSNGEVVRWDEVPVDESIEPEHPAPVLNVVAADEDPGSGEEADEAESSAGNSANTEPAAAAELQDDSTPMLPTALSAAAVLIALGAAALAGASWRRSRGRV